MAGLALALASAPAQTLSPSKLSAHLINSYTAGASNIIAGHPRTLKVLGLDSGFPSSMAQAMRDYKAQVPGGKVVVRIYSPKNYSLSDDATGSAADFWTNILQKGVNYLAPADRGLIDYLEGPNEGETPTLGYPDTAPDQASQWFNQFWTNLTPLIVAAGYKPCIGSIAVGNPGGTQAQMQSYLAAFVPALRQAQAAGGAWSYHAYTINYTTDLATEIWYSLRYRQFYSYFASAYPDLNTMPLILTEGGVDASGSPTTSGWQARGTASDYQHWLNWFDQQMQQDACVLGCTLFEIGNPESWGWPSFDLEPIASWMRTYLITPATVPPAPTGATASIGNGSVTLSWSNVPLTPTSWSVKRATNSAGPYYTLATNITAGIQTTTYTDTSVGNLATYYYVITAVNSFGESDASAPLAANFPAPSAINCGGPAIGSFLSDIYFSAGTAYSTASAVSTNGVVNPAPAAVYQSQRYSDLTYTLPRLAPNTAYKVRLHFAEIFWTSTGQRVFNVLVNGVQVLTNFDIVRVAGSAYKANVQEFNAISDAAGVITVQLVTVTDNASINGIEVVPNPGNTAPAAPTGLAVSFSGSLVTLTWSVPAGATSFSVKRSLTNGGPYLVIASNLTQATYRDPSFLVNSNYYYVVTALNALGESPPSAQVSLRPYSGLPDLVVTGMTWTPANLYSPNNAVFSAQVLNRGSASTPAGPTLRVGFSVDGTKVTWSAYYTAALAPGATVTLPATSGAGGVNYWTATPGPHTLVAMVDDLDFLSESIEDNNSLTVPLTVKVIGYAFNSGGGAVGGFAADGSFAGSANTYSVTNVIATNGLANPAPAAVYQSERWGEFAYVLNGLTPGSNYTVRLHFAEISPSVTNPGDRRFNISLNGLQVFTDFDVLAGAGGKYRALTRDIRKQADSSGAILVQFTRGSANEPKCSGIEVFGSAPPAQPPAISSLGVTNKVAYLTWQTLPGVIYQVQRKDDLGQTNWTAVGPVQVAPGATLTITDDLTGVARRFYRLVQIN